METLNKSILDFLSEATEKPCGSAALLRDDRPAQPGSHSVPVDHKISDLLSLLLAVSPRAAGNAEYFSVSLHY